MLSIRFLGCFLFNFSHNYCVVKLESLVVSNNETQTVPLEFSAEGGIIYLNHFDEAVWDVLNFSFTKIESGRYLVAEESINENEPSKRTAVFSFRFSKCLFSVCFILASPFKYWNLFFRLIKMAFFLKKGFSKMTYDQKVERIIKALDCLSSVGASYFLFDLQDAKNDQKFIFDILASYNKKEVPVFVRLKDPSFISFASPMKKQSFSTIFSGYLARYLIEVSSFCFVFFSGSLLLKGGNNTFIGIIFFFFGLFLFGLFCILTSKILSFDNHVVLWTRQEFHLFRKNDFFICLGVLLLTLLVLFVLNKSSFSGLPLALTTIFSFVYIFCFVFFRKKAV